MAHSHYKGYRRSFIFLMVYLNRLKKPNLITMIWSLILKIISFYLIWFLHFPKFQVLAFTNGGDGARSPVSTATTEEDIPGAPDSVKALAMTDASILVSWQRPKEPNGLINEYTVYIKEIDRSREPAPKSFKVKIILLN